MRSFIASLRSLTLPFGTTSGTRLVLDGTAGTISGYDASDDLAFKLDGTDASWGNLPSGTRVEIDGDNGVINIYDASNNLVATLSEDGLEVINPLTGGTAVVTPAVSGAPATPVVEVQTNLDSGTTHGTPSATPHGSNDLELRWIGLSNVARDDSNSFTPPATYTERTDQLSGYTGLKSYASLATKALASSADTGTQNFTSSHTFSGADANSGGVGATIDIKSRTGASAAFRSVSTVSPPNEVYPVVPTAVFAKPTGTVEGDMLVAIFTDVDGIPPDPLIPSEAGWSQLFRGWVVIHPAWASMTQVWYKIAGASEPSEYHFTSISNLGNGCGAMVAIQDAESATITADILIDGVSVVTPPGAIVAYGGTTAPGGWVLCDGSAISRTTFERLFGVIGTTFGAGDGSTTFNVPDLRQRFPLGKAAAGTGATLGGTGGTIDHIHALDPGYAKIFAAAASPYIRMLRKTVASWADNISSTLNITVGGASGNNQTLGADLGGSSDTANPPFIAVNYLIKT